MLRHELNTLKYLYSDEYTLFSIKSIFTSNLKSHMLNVKRQVKQTKSIKKYCRYYNRISTSCKRKEI